MLKIEKTDIHGWEAAIRGARNSFNSWDKSDSEFLTSDGDHHDIMGNSGPWYGDDGWDEMIIGPNDADLMKKLAKAGPSHAKYRRFITVTMDVTGPLYWWKEMDTYKVGTVGNSCSTMHKIADKEFELKDFSHEHLEDIENVYYASNALYCPYFKQAFKEIINLLNTARTIYLETKDNKYWWQMIQLLPSSYNQKRTLLVNYEVLANIYHQRKGHRLDEWKTFCDWIERLPYSELITGKETGIDSETVEELVECGNVYPISPEECRDLMKGDSND